MTVDKWLWIAGVTVCGGVVTQTEVVQDWRQELLFLECCFTLVDKGDIAVDLGHCIATKKVKGQMQMCP